MSKHIVIDARIINSSTGRYVERLLTHLEKIDTENKYTVLVPSKDLRYWRPRSNNFKVKAANYKNYSFNEQVGFCVFLTKLRPDLVHFCMPQQPVLYMGKRVTTVHDLTLLNTYNSDKNWLIYHAKQFIGKYVFKAVGKFNKYIITPTEFVRKGFAEFANIPLSKITVTYEAADIIKRSTTPYEVPFTKFIMYVGAQSDYKNIKRLGDAHQKLLKKYPTLGLVLVGKKTEMHLRNEKYFSKRGYKNLHFTDFIADEQLNWLFEKTDAYVFPSLSEGFGLPALEAMSHGAPVASSNATCLPEVYGDAALYFDPMATDDMVDKISRILDDKDLRNELRKKGQEQVKKYSWDRMATQTLEVYNEALKDVKN